MSGTDDNDVWQPWIKPVRRLDWGGPRLSDAELRARLEREFGRLPYPDDLGCDLDTGAITVGSVPA